MRDWRRYAGAAAILLGVVVGISAFLWIPVCIALTMWFGGSAVTALQLEGRIDALVAHGRWTQVSHPVFCIVFASEVMAIVSTLTLFACLLVLWVAERRGGRGRA